MLTLSPHGQDVVADLSRRYGFSTEAVIVAMQAVSAGNGTMAQFSHPEFGGGAQWMQGGMTMVGDMFNNALKAKVDALCTELSGLIGNPALWMTPATARQHSGSSPAVSIYFPPESSGTGWPADLGSPASTGSQNDIRYAVFPATRRLAIEVNGQTTIYDTLDHQIGGVSQQQGFGASLTFTSQYGLVRLEDLPLISR